MTDDTLTVLLRSLAPSWQADAGCKEAPGVNFFPTQGDDVGPALQVCGRCLVMLECRQYALEHNLVGIWGGTTGAARKAMRRAAKAGAA